MATWTPYAAGKKVYKGATNAPTRGMVNPTGYVNRTLNKPKASTSRSGLAAAALRRVQAAKQVAAVKPVITRDVRVPTAAKWYPKVSVTPSATGQLTAAQKLAKTKTTVTAKRPATPVKPATAADALKRAKSVLGPKSPITKALEKAVNPPPKKETALPYDEQAEDERAAALRERNDFFDKLGLDRQALETNYTTGRRAQEVAQPTNYRRLLNAYAGRGMAFSSGYGQAYGDESQRYADVLANLENTRATGRTQLERGLTKFEEDYANRLADIQKAQARRLAARAGDLDLAAAKSAPVKPAPAKPTPKPAPKPPSRVSKTVKKIAARKPTTKKPTSTRARSAAIAAAAKRKIAAKGKK